VSFVSGPVITYVLIQDSLHLLSNTINPSYKREYGVTDLGTRGLSVCD
jgi:hypothetical protein